MSHFSYTFDVIWASNYNIPGETTPTIKCPFPIGILSCVVLLGYLVCEKRYGEKSKKI